MIFIFCIFINVIENNIIYINNYRYNIINNNYLFSLADMNNKNIAIQLTIFIIFINSILFTNYYKNRENRINDIYQ